LKSKFNLQVFDLRIMVFILRVKVFILRAKVFDLKQHILVSSAKLQIDLLTNEKFTLKNIFGVCLIKTQVFILFRSVTKVKYLTLKLK